MRTGLDSRRGVLLYFALFAVLVLGLFAVHFHRMASHAQRMSYRFAQAENWHQVAEAAMEEAFQRVADATADPASDISQKLRAQATSLFKIDLPLINRECRERYVGRAEVNATCRVVDVRNGDSKSRRFHPGEFCGTLELAVAVDLSGKRGTEVIPGISLIRHHDFRVASIVSVPSRRAPYAHNFILDYALFSRFGLQDFRRTQGRILNDEQQNRVKVDQEALSPDQRGLIFIGGTEKVADASTAEGNETPKDNFVFINTDDSWKDLIPPLDGKKIRKVGLEECCKLLPELEQYKSDLNGLEGVFIARHGPLFRTDYAGDSLKREQQTRDVLLNFQEGADANRLLPQHLLSPAMAKEAAQADAILRGAIRQRFMYFVEFKLDVSNIPNMPAGQAKQAVDSEANRVACLPNSPRLQLTDEKYKTFLKALWEIAGSETQSPLFSRISTDYLLKGGQSADSAPDKATFAIPKFYRRDGQEVGNLWGDDSGENGLRVYRHGGLHALKAKDLKDLEKYGIFNAKTGALRLRGVVSLSEHVSLTNPSGAPLTVTGQGVLIAPSFTLGSGIAKSRPSDICILFANAGPITVDTDQEINASLLALNPDHNGTVQARKPLKMRGCLAADHLEFNRWTPGNPHLIYYDPMLHATSDLYQVTVSRWITFQRLIVKEGPQSGPSATP